MIRFSIFGIPVTVEPWFWLVAFLLGGGISNIQHGNEGLLLTAVWMIVMFLSVLVHELGHAITGQKLGGGRVWIRLWAFGGLAYQQGAQFNKKHRATMIAMGPGAGFLLLIVSILACMLLLGPSVTLGIFAVTIGAFVNPVLALFDLQLSSAHNEVFMDFAQDPTNFLKWNIFFYLFQINLFWGIINLFPIMPLDGGQLLDTFIRSRKKLYMIGTFTAIATAIGTALAFNSMFMPLLFGMFAFNNYNAYKESKY